MYINHNGFEKKEKSDLISNIRRKDETAAVSFSHHKISTFLCSG
jgi:hypothetical protein